MATPIQMGYKPNDDADIVTRTVPGTSVQIPVVAGPAGELLIFAAAFFHAFIEPIEGGGRGFHPRDDWGFAKRLIRGSLSKLSWHAFGLAIDLNATRHPLGVRGTFTREQIRKFNAFLDTLDGCLRWGENYLIRKDGMHIEVMKTQAECAAVLRRLEGQDAEPGTRNLRRGMIGDDVVWLQKRLGISADGVFGKQTAAAVRRFERAHNKRGGRPVLKVDAFVGRGTWHALDVTPDYAPQAA